MLKCIYAECEPNHSLGYRGKLPWEHLKKDGKFVYDLNKDDMRLFQDETIGRNIILGRKTWESLGKKLLKNRKYHYIVSSTPYDYSKGSSNNWSYINFDKLLTLLVVDPFEEYVCIGGPTLISKLVPYISLFVINKLEYNLDILKKDGFDHNFKSDINFNIEEYSSDFEKEMSYTYSTYREGKLVVERWYNKNMTKRNPFSF